MKIFSILPLSVLMACGAPSGDGPANTNTSNPTRSASQQSNPADGSMLQLRTQPWQNMFTEWNSAGPCQIRYDDQYLRQSVLDHLYPNFDRSTVTVSNFNLLLGYDTNDTCTGNVRHTGPGSLMYIISGNTVGGQRQSKLIWAQSQWVDGQASGYVNLIGFDTTSRNYPNPSSEVRYRINDVGQYKITTELVPVGETSESGASIGIIGGEASFLNGQLRYSVRPQVPAGQLTPQTRRIRIILQLHSSINPLAGTVDVRKFVREVTLNASNGFSASGAIEIENVVTAQESRLGPVAFRQKLDEIEISAFFID